MRTAISLTNIAVGGVPVAIGMLWRLIGQHRRHTAGVTVSDRAVADAGVRRLPPR